VSDGWRLIAENDLDWDAVNVAPHELPRAQAESLIRRASEGLTLGYTKLGLQAPDGTVVWLYQASAEDENLWEPYVPEPPQPVWTARLYRGEELMASQQVLLPPAMNGSVTVTHTFAITEN
jgi:hypothetical protein